MSYKAHRESTDFNEREARREFDRERSEFLIRIEHSTKLFERVEDRIGVLLTNIENQPESIKASLGNVVDNLRADLSYLQGCLRQSRALWEENFEINHNGLVYHKARHLALLEDDEKFAAEALDRADKAEESLNTLLFLSNPIVVG